MKEPNTAQDVGSIIQDMKLADEIRAQNRVLIQRQANGLPPFTDAQMAENKLDVNFSTKTCSNLLATARRQYENAFGKTAQYFHVSLEDAPADKSMEWSQIISKETNRPMKRSREYWHLIRETGAAVMLSGVAIKMWFDKEQWRPTFIGLEDWLCPTDTPVTLDGLSHFAVRRGLTAYDLFRKTIGKGKNIDPGWNVGMVKRVLQGVKRNDSTTIEPYDWINNPEKMAELYKQNCVYWQSDAVPKVWAWDFYVQDDETGEWNLKIVLDREYSAAYGTLTPDDKEEFLYESKTPVTDSLDKILHIQFGDSNHKAPFMFYSVRSLGFLLFDLCQIQDMTMNRFVSKVHEDFLLLMRVSDPSDRAAVDKIHFGLRYGLLPEGINFVTKDQRYQFDANLAQMLFSNLKQYMGESASSYTQDIDSGTEKERTKFEVQALLAQTSALLSSLLNNAYVQAEFEYREICRRLCLPKTRDKDALAFQKRCKEQGVPEKWLDTERWNIRAETIMGGGSKQLELAAADKLMSVRQFMEPSAQSRTLHKLVLAVTDSAAEADELAPIKPTKVTDTVFDAALAWGSLMTGVAMPIKEGVSHREVAQTILRMMAMKVQQIAQTDNMGTPQDIIGLTNAANYVGQHLAKLEEDESEKQTVKQMNDILGKLGNLVKAFGQRQQEAASKQNGQLDPETQMKLQGQAALTQQKLQAKAAADAQKLQTKDAQFRLKARHDSEKTRADMFEAGMTAVVEAQAAHSKTAAEIKAIEKKSSAEAAASKKKSEASSQVE